MPYNHKCIVSRKAKAKIVMGYCKRRPYGLWPNGFMALTVWRRLTLIKRSRDEKSDEKSAKIHWQIIIG